MIILAVGAFSYSAYSRSSEQEQEALESYNYTAAKVENVKTLNRQIKEQTTRIRQNPQISAQVAQEQLRLVRPNEVVVSLR
jgi:cell division protein FtsB